MFPHAVMKNWHPMLGIDLHICNLPPPAPPVPMTPYKTGMLLSGTAGWFLTAKYCPTHFSAGYGYTMAKGTDIGPFIPHVGPPSITLAIEMVFSASKSHFGPRNYLEKDNYGAETPIAAALGGFINPNLNCGTPCPTPTGFVLALNTHGVGMTAGDIVSGLAQMTIDAAVQTALYYAGNGIGDGLGSFAKRLAPQAFSRTAARQAARAAGGGAGLGPAARQIRATRNSRLTTGVAGFVNIFLGGPMGADAGADSIGGPTVYGIGGVGKAIGSGGDAIADYATGGPPTANPGQNAPIVPMI